MNRGVANEMKNRVEFHAPSKFLQICKRFGFSPGYLALLLVMDLCSDNPSELLVLSDDPGLVCESVESEEHGVSISQV